MQNLPVPPHRNGTPKRTRILDQQNRPRPSHSPSKPPTGSQTVIKSSHTAITQVVAGDSISVAVSDEGIVYAWGTFRGPAGVLGFAPGILKQATPRQIPVLLYFQLAAPTSTYQPSTKNTKPYYELSN